MNLAPEWQVSNLGFYSWYLKTNTNVVEFSQGKLILSGHHFDYTYTGGQKKETSGVTRWNKEKWTDEHGNICGSKNNKNIKKCRPSVRVTDSTPVTWSELTAKEKKAVISKKKQVGMGKKAPNIKRKTKKFKQRYPE